MNFLNFTIFAPWIPDPDPGDNNQCGSFTVCKNRTHFAVQFSELSERVPRARLQAAFQLLLKWAQEIWLRSGR
jgi:hypothetical protein